MTEPKLVHQDSKKRLVKGVGDVERRSRFKERSKNLERGISAPELTIDAGSKHNPKAKAPLPFTEEEVLTIGHGMGHEFVRKTYFQPTYCHHCAEMLWGLKGQGFQCKGMGPFCCGTVLTSFWSSSQKWSTVHDGMFHNMVHYKNDHYAC